MATLSIHNNCNKMQNTQVSSLTVLQRSSFVYQEVHMLLRLHDVIFGSCTRKEEHDYRQRISPIASFNLMQASPTFIHAHSIPFKVIKVHYSSNFHPRILLILFEVQIRNHHLHSSEPCKIIPLPLHKPLPLQDYLMSQTLQLKNNYKKEFSYLS
ncbi:unnamed protein product [Vicia faba]|uniref:Uncharacterized protein n=1 Tax=Vicia faba TaxID=3906 RepID=A0AAV0ZR54_VICFA|nr:unnamed protein product [Vicia faba]